MKTLNIGRTSEPSRKLKTLLPFVALIVALVPTLASAHAKLASSSPAEGATVQAGLTSITLTFSEELSVDQSHADLNMASGAAVSGASSAVDKAKRTVITVQTPALQPGTYQVKWHSVTEDDNGITDGTLNFTVAGAADTSSTATTQQATPGAETLPQTALPQTALPATGSTDSNLPISVLVVAFALLMLVAGARLVRRATR